MLGIHVHAHACAEGHVPFYTSSCQKVARLSAVQGRTTDIADYGSLACTMLVHLFVAHLKPEHLMVHPKLTSVK